MARDSSIDPLLKGVKGFLLPTSFHWSTNYGVSYEVTDSNAKVLADYYKYGLPGMAVKRFGNYTEIYCGAPCALTPQLCRNISVEAGLTPFLDTDDYCGAGAGLLHISALTAGRKIVTLPEKVKGVKVLTEQKIDLNGNKLSVDLKVAELLILKLEY